MLINSSIGNHTLALFGAAGEAQENRLIAPDAPAANAADSARYATGADRQGAPALRPAAAPVDAASAYRPGDAVEDMGTYSDPRTSAATDSPTPAYDGPSYTERAGGDLLGTVLADIKAIRGNQLAAMKEQFQARVEATIGRALKEGEDVEDFNTQAIISNEDWQLGNDARVLQSRTSFVDREGPRTVRSGLTQEYVDSTTEEERFEHRLNRLVDHRVAQIDISIREANQYSQQYGVGGGLLPELTGQELATLREQVMEQFRADVASGDLILTYDPIINPRS